MQGTTNIANSQPLVVVLGDPPLPRSIITWAIISPLLTNTFGYCDCGDRPLYINVI